MASSQRGPARAAAIRTFLIADIRGYTRFTAQHGDEAASRLATKFAEVAAEGVGAWGGELVEQRGDEVLAVFDSARQALRAAVELQSAFADETYEEPALPLGVGIGLDAGEAVPVGDGYRGGALNLAARLCAIAGPGDVFASEGLVRLAGHVDGLEQTPLEATTFKGYDEPIAAVRIKESDGLTGPIGGAPARPQAEPPPLPPELDSIVPLAGRESELRWLSWHWRRARHGHGRALVLSGVPGIGKTRLSSELAASAHAAGATVVYLPALRGTEEAGFEELTELPASALVIVDDLDAAATPMAREAERFARGLAGRPSLLLVTHRREAAPAVMALAERLAPPEQRRQLGPLEPDAVRAIAALYAGRAVEDLPLEELVARSGGVPAAVHQVASQWARTAASRRLEASADRTDAGRRGLREAEAVLIEDVADLESARERARLYAAETTDEGDRASARTICPYKGLAAFEAADADYYFGRERLIAELIARFVGSTFLGLVGDSGSGKSSALQAGLLPALAGGVLPGSESWPQAVMRPGEHPLGELGRALARAMPDRALSGDDPSVALDAALAALAPGQRLVVVVDQFEEVFNATRDDAERSAFIDLITAERPGLKVIVAIRADHYGRCAAYPALARVIGASHVLVGPLGPLELAAVVEHPAQRVGLRVEAGLTEALVADAGSEPGVLSLLSTALLELWQARENGRLTLASYRATGGLRGAVARLAEVAFAELDPYRQTIARAILLRLAGPGEGAQLVRRRVPLNELDADRDPAVAEVLETLTGARLLTSGDGFVEVAHEALLREWPRLQEWLDEDAAGRVLRLHLIGAVRDWEQRSREPGDLYRGARLATALEWAADHQVELNAAERTFLDESRQASERDVERQRRTNRILRALLAGAAVLLLVAVGAFGFAAFQASRASDEAQHAEQQRIAAEQQRVVAQGAANRARSGELTASAVAVLNQDPSLSKLLALEAGSIGGERPLRLTTTLHEAWAADPIVGRYVWPKDRNAGALWTDLDPSGKRLVASGASFNGSDHLEVADVKTGARQWLYPAVADGAKVGPSFFSADGAQVIAGFYSDLPDVRPPANAPLGALIFDSQSGTVLRRIDLGGCGGIVTGVSKTRLLVQTAPRSPDGNCVWDSPTVDLIDLASGRSKLLAAKAGLSSTLSGDGRYAAFDELTEDAISPVVVDVDTGKRVLKIDRSSVVARQGSSGTRRLNGDGSLLLYGDRPILVYDVASGKAEPIAELGGQTGESNFAEFAPSGDTVYATVHDRSLRQWDARRGNQLAIWPAVGSGRPSISADGRLVLVADSHPPAAALLDTAPRGEVGAVDTCPGYGPGFVGATSLAVGGGFAAFLESCGNEQTREVTNVIDVQRLQVLYSVLHEGFQTLRISPDGEQFVAQQSVYPKFSPLDIRELRTGEQVVELQGMCTWDAVAADRLPREQTGKCKAYPQRPFPIAATSIAWSPDGTMIAANDLYDGYVAVWDARDGRLLHAVPDDPDHYAGGLIFSPDSKKLVVSLRSFDDNSVQMLSTETWSVIRQNTLEPSLQGLDPLELVGYTADGSSLLAFGENSGGSGGGALVWLDPQTLKVSQSVNDAFEGRPKSGAMSPDGSLLATGASDGVLRVWETRDGSLVQEIHVGDVQVQGVAFTDNNHLAVTPQTGNLLIMTLDTDELLSVVRKSFTRGFTATECKTYGFDPCPTLEQLRSGG